MEASTYAWAVILTFFVLYGTVMWLKTKIYFELIKSIYHPNKDSAKEMLSSIIIVWRTEFGARYFTTFDFKFYIYYYH